MKKTSLFFLIVLFGSLNIKAQDRFSYQVASDSSNALFGSLVLDEFGLELHTLLKEGKIQFYSDSNFRFAREKDDTMSFFYTPERIQMINPNNPDDPYDLIDTMVYSYISPYQWVVIKSGQDYLQLVSHPGQNIFIRKKDVKGIEQSRLLIATLGAYPSDLIQGDNFGLYVWKFYDELQWKVYNVLFDKQLHLYKDHNFKTYYSDYEKAEFGIRRENWQIINPENPTDPYDLIDTVVTTPANKEIFKSMLFLTRNEVNGQSKLLGISLNACDTYPWPLFSTHSLRIQSPYTDCNRGFGWIKAEDLEKALGKDDMYFIRINYVWSLSHLNR